METKGKSAKRYSSEFKIAAVKLVLNEDYSVSKAAQRLGVSAKTLGIWKEPYEEGRLVAGKKQAQATGQPRSRNDARCGKNSEK
ncbi:MAG: transposase [Trueperaceae bacterium]